MYTLLGYSPVSAITINSFYIIYFIVCYALYKIIIIMFVLCRSLGVHVSKVRSLTLDAWEPESLKVKDY